MTYILLLVAVLCGVSTTVLSSPSSYADVLPNVGLNATEQIKYYGYPLEVHDVITKDGYILQLHRIPHGVNDSDKESGKPVVLFIPGMLCTSGVLIINGPSRSLPLLLADLGYDVWIGNQRGSTYSRRHVSYTDTNIFSKQYWNFSNHEIGVYDLPAFIDFVLNFTGQESLYFVGHSQGTTVYFIMTSEVPAYNEKIRLSIIMAPVTYTSNVFNPIARIVGDFTDVERAVLMDVLHLFGAFTESKVYTDIGATVCSTSSPLVELCTNALFLLCGFDSEQFNRTLIPLIVSVAPAGTSTKAVVQYGQNYKSGYFRQYDYGIIGNILQYGQFSPPNYNISRATAPVAIYYGANDWLSSSIDVSRLANEVANLAKLYLVPWDKFNHLDFIWATDVYELLYQDIIEVIKKY